MAQLRSAGFGLAATLVEGGDDVFRASLPSRLVYVMGAEGEGMDRGLASECDMRVSIPGSGARNTSSPPSTRVAARPKPALRSCAIA
ncbi:TrmH family RNA methyltransferase [Stenotrophomonas maltophilia]|uniref:TrmH family RNA methyltransferase n=1 Tax=Stenotrophomonas maltophilia TaxID=40324 RepID=UPI003CCFEC87